MVRPAHVGRDTIVKNALGSSVDTTEYYGIHTTYSLSHIGHLVRGKAVV